ncbi:MAG: nucleotide exchange factor GrpE [Thermodesulfovibrio sp.]|nr:nucleotide exchange factor GrpE [Thermodesulfovibrio sp.]
MEEPKSDFEIDENESLEDALKEVKESLEQQKGAQEGAVDADAKELNDKYLRLYADFENYRKRVNKDKEELVRFGNESLIYELLPILDSLDLALKHATGESQSGLVQGVEMTLKELLRTLEKFGLTRISAAGMVFDPALHHAMVQVERDDMDEKMVAEEMRPGYVYRDKVLRPALVSVSVRPQKASDAPGSAEYSAADRDGHEIKINRITEEE